MPRSELDSGNPREIIMFQSLLLGHRGGQRQRSSTYKTLSRHQAKARIDDMRALLPDNKA